MKKLNSILLVAAIITFIACLWVNVDRNKAIESSHTVRYIAAEGGYIEGEAEQLIEDGGNSNVVVARADSGYEFAGWSDGVSAAGRREVRVHNDITVTAYFTPENSTADPNAPFILRYTASEGGHILMEGVPPASSLSQKVAAGESGTAVTAVPEEGYEFVRWSDGVTTATRTDGNVTSDITVTAEFAPDADYEPFAGGDGSEENPYQIDSVRRLRNMELYPDAHYVLTADIVLTEAGEGGSNFAPLFSDERMFGGTLNGQGHKISNLTVYNTETFYSGLFSCISASGSVTNLVLENASVSGTNYIGGIAGYTLGAVTDCTVSGSITYIDKNGYKVFAGGIAGRSEASLNGCVANVTVTVDNARAETTVGGIVGYIAYSGSQSEPMTLHHKGTITVTVDISADGNNAKVGGVIGYVYWDTPVCLSSSSHDGDITASARDTWLGGLVGEGYSTITDSYTTGNVMSTSHNYSKAGGLVGGGYSTITNSYATGDVTGTSHNYYDSNAGGLVGSGCSTITNSYAMGNVTSTSRHNSCVGGLVGYGDGMNTTIIMDSYAMGNVTSIGHDNSRAGGLVGGAFLLTVHNSYSVSRVSAESKNGNVCIGGLVGYIDNTAPLENAHWYGGEETAAEYAIGYSETLGISTSRGSTRHNSVEEFYTLADALNAGREEPVWEHKGEDTLPTLIVRTDENQQ